MERMKTFFTFLFFLAWVIGLMCAANAEQYLMVDQHGNVYPPGYAAGLTEIAQAEAAAAAASQAAELVKNTTAAASNVVNDVVEALTGTIGFGYVTGHTISFSGSVEISTNATAQFVFCEFGAAGTMTTNGVEYSGHYVWHAYSEPMNTMPAIKYRRELDGTNTWEFVEYQSTAEYANETVNGVTYKTVYRSTVWMPSAYDSAFFLAFCEIYGGGAAGGVFDVVGGFKIGGKTGYTGPIQRDGLWWIYEAGALMSVTNQEPQQ